jgi:hypothetical protein
MASAQEYTQQQLPSDIFNSGDGDIKEYNGETYKITNTGRGTRLLTPLSSEEKYNRAAQAQLDLYAKANQPAIESLNSSIPEIQNTYATERSRLAADKDPLNARYDQLIASIKGQQTSDTNSTVKNLAREYGRRGIPLSSTTFGDEQNAQLEPINQFYTGKTVDTNLAREQGLKQISDLITQLTGEETTSIRSVKNAIAQLQSGAANSALTNTNDLYKTNLQQALAQLGLDQTQKQNDITNSLAERTFNQYTLPLLNYTINKPYSTSSTSSTTPSVSLESIFWRETNYGI